LVPPAVPRFLALRSLAALLRRRSSSASASASSVRAGHSAETEIGTLKAEAGELKTERVRV